MSLPKRGLFSFLGCVCRDGKSVSLSEESQNPKSDAEHLLTPASSHITNGETPRNFSDLLRQLKELEQSVLSWNFSVSAEAHANKGDVYLKDQVGRVDESVVVVKESNDPLSDFRRSMLQMIVAKEIVEPEELGELLRRLLSLNLPEQHDAILRAFDEIWNHIFSKYWQTPEFLMRFHHSR